METRKITLEGWERSGEGCTAVSYNHKEDPRKMLKVFSSNIVGPQYAEMEFGLSRRLEELGLNTPRALEMVDCEGFSSIIYERIVKKKSVSRLCASHPEEIGRWAEFFAKESYSLHQTVCERGDFASRRDQMLSFVEGHSGYNARTKRVVRELSEELGDECQCLHGDLQTGNMIVDMETEKAYWIDLGCFARGNPMYDLACLRFFYVHPIGRLLGSRMCHMRFAQLTAFWKAFVESYSRLSGIEDLDKKASRYVVLYLVYTIGLQDYGKFTLFVFDRYINYIAAKVGRKK